MFFHVPDLLYSLENVSKFEELVPIKNKEKRVAVYARVSTEQDRRQISFKSQVDYYTKK